MRDAGIVVLALAGVVVGCARKALHDADGSVALDASVPVVVDGAADVPASQDGSSLSGFVMIDDVEDRADLVLPESAFYWHSTTSIGLGNWFVSSSDGSTRDVGRAVIDPPRGDSRRAREIRGAEGARAANMWAQLDHPQGLPIDLSGYAGIVFWSRLSGSGGIVNVVLDSLPGGGGAYFKSDFTRLPTWEIRVSEQWQRFMLPFADRSVSSGVVSIDFVVSGTAGPFDLWIDDLALVCRGACP